MSTDNVVLWFHSISRQGAGVGCGLEQDSEGRMESKGLQAHKRNPLAGVFMRMSRMFLRHGTEKGSVWRPF